MNGYAGASVVDNRMASQLSCRSGQHVSPAMVAGDALIPVEAGTNEVVVTVEVAYRVE